jgi:hypothetical protein
VRDVLRPDLEVLPVLRPDLEVRPYKALKAAGRFSTNAFVPSF